MTRRVERRAVRQPNASAMHGGPLGISRYAGWHLVVIGACLVGLANVAIGHLVWLGPAYLLVIGVAAWILGWRVAVGVALACMALTYVANGFGFYALGEAWQWNLALRWLVVLAAIGLIEVIRASFLREWRAARVDLLTGAMNRQAFFEITAKPVNTSWSLIAYIDLDGFKRINDALGHTAGDETLKAFASGVMKRIREGDLFARLGGDEFVVVMNVRDEAAAKVTAARLYLATNSSLLRAHSSVRCSLGVLILPPASGPTARFLQLADQLMYEAKRHGGSLMTATLRDADKIYRHTDLEIKGHPAQPLSDDRVAA